MPVLASKNLPPALLTHLRSTHGFDRAHIDVREGNTASIEGGVDDSHVLSVFDMERGPVVIEHAPKLSPLGEHGWNREAAIRGDYTKKAAFNEQQVGIVSSHNYSGLSYISMKMSSGTLAAYFSVGAVAVAAKLSEPELLVLHVVRNYVGSKRKSALTSYRGPELSGVLQLLQQKKLLSVNKAGAMSITTEGREALSYAKTGELYALERKYLGEYF